MVPKHSQGHGLLIVRDTGSEGASPDGRSGESGPPHPHDTWAPEEIGGSGRMEPGLRWLEGGRSEEVATFAAAVSRLVAGGFDAVLLTGRVVDDPSFLASLLRDRAILASTPDGVALLDAENTIRWCNPRFREWCGLDAAVGRNFYAAIGGPEILGPDFCPFHTALSTGRMSSSTLRVGDHHYFHVHAVPVGFGADAKLLPRSDCENGRESLACSTASAHVLVTVRDVTIDILEQQKRAAIHQAGQQLADLSPDELADMTVEERIDLLKSNIIHYSKALLQFDVVEIRLLDPQTGRLEPLLAEGMQEEAESRILFARPERNGVTGYVAATGRSYLCSDTTKDPLYLEGCKGAKSSLTVPLVLHDQVIGTFNVESPEPGGFKETDLQFLEIFSRDVAAALNTLELLVAEKASTAAESVEAIHGAVALPVDDILNDAVSVMERYIGHDAEVVERLQRILRNARDIKQVIQRVGERMTPAAAQLQGWQGGQGWQGARQSERRGRLAGKRVLVVDADGQVRSAAHSLLERYGCVVETARDGAEAASMVRGGQEPYDVVIADIRLPDMTGYELLVKLREIVESVPMVLMTGFGYDPGHSIVKARQAGIDLVLFKPFRIDQLLDTIERALGRPIDPPEAVCPRPGEQG
jgi:CheY-like chemotaxis protein/PAS domain-containing protein